MSNYTQITDFSAKDALPSGDPAKKIVGAEVDAEFAAIAAAIASKADDNAVVHTSGTEVVAGDKTFSGNNTHSGNNTFSGTLTMSGKAINHAAPVDVASAATTDIGAAASNNVRITGTTTITSLGTANAGIRRTVRFADALTLTHNDTSLILPGAANITTAADDTAEFLSLGSGNWICLWYKPASVSPVVATQAQMEAASSTGVLVTPGRVRYHPGVLKGWVKFTVAALVEASHNVDSVTDNGIGDWTVNWDTDFSDGNYHVDVNVLATNVTAIHGWIGTQTAGTTRVQIGTNTGASEANITSVYVSAAGDQ